MIELSKIAEAIKFRMEMEDMIYDDGSREHTAAFAALHALARHIAKPLQSPAAFLSACGINTNEG